jgi:uncharacterized membrane protein YraQ (UPF0718 family)
MDGRRELRTLLGLVAALVAAWWLPVGDARFDDAVRASLELVRSYAREHVVLCLVPALWIAGGIAAFVRKASVLAHLGPRAPKAKAYGVASVSGTILAVCSCTILPLFAGIHRMGAGLGPAVTLLYAGPAINVLAIVLTARVLGPELGIARAVGAVAFSVVVGMAMQWLFRRETAAPTAPATPLDDEPAARSLGRTGAFFGAFVAVLVFVNWGAPRGDTGLWAAVFAAKWWIAGAAAVALAGILHRWMGLDGRLLAATSVAVALAALVVPAHPEVAVLVGCAGLVACTAGRGGEAGEWFDQSWGYAKQIVPLLLVGVLVAGLLLGTPDREGLIPAAWVRDAVGGEGLRPSLLAALAGALMYFATLTEVPILQGLVESGMGRGPALALLLAGPAVSLPSLVVLHSIVGGRKTLTYAGLVVLTSALAGWTFGALS